MILMTLLAAAGYLGWARIAEGYIPAQMGTLASSILALAPAFIWWLLAAFGVGENKSVRRVTFLLWLVTGALYVVLISPLISDLFQVSEWLHVTWWSDLLGRLLVIAPLEVFLIYLVLRLGVYPTEAMQTLTDGLFYGTAAALGIASAINLMEVWSPGFSSLSLQAFRVGEITLAYAAVGVWLGYFVACARFKRINVFYLAAGVLLTILLHGMFFFTLGVVDVQTLWPHPLAGIIVSGVFIALSLAVVYWRMRKCHKAFMRIAALVEIKAEQETPRSVLADVVQMVESHQLEPRPSPPPPPSDSFTTPRHDTADELDSLKQSWEALIADQEERHD
jgi:uncharacterized membrane protein YqjE